MREGDAFATVRPRGQLPICGQCRQSVKPVGLPPVAYDDLNPELRAELDWEHLDGTPQCPRGLAEAWRRFVRFWA